MHRLWISLVVLSAVFSCKMADTGTGSVSGRVVRYGSELPMSGVNVVYGDSIILTDSNGEYLFEGIPENLQGIRFLSDGYYPLFRQVKVLRDNVVTCDVELEAVPSAWAVGSIDSEYGTILYSSDCGHTWIRQGGQSSIPSVNLNDVCAVTDRICWAVGDFDLFGNTPVILNTADGGQTWTNQGRSLSLETGISLGSVLARDSDTVWAAASDAGVVLRTGNGGKQWEVVLESERMEYFTAISSPDGYNVWCCGKSIGGGAAVEFTSDGGRTWKFVQLPGLSEFQTASDIYAVNSEEIYVCGTNAMGLFRSRDGGETWTKVESMPSVAGLRSMDCVSGSLFWLLQDGGIVYSTADAFGTVRSVPAADASYSDGTASAVDFMRDGSTGVLSVLSGSGSTGAIYFTEDGGISWLPADIPFGFAIYAMDFVGGFN